MKRAALAFWAAAAVLAGGALVPTPEAKARRPALRSGTGTANPSALIALEIAFARRAKEKGQWKAFREYADEDAMMFVPQEVLAREWLGKQEEPDAANALDWRPHEVWMSCDGTLGVTKGAWQRGDGAAGWFTTIWKRRKNGQYRWVIDHGDTLAAPVDKPEMLSARVANCRSRPNAPPSITPPADARTFVGGNSLDGTLRWNATVLSGNDARRLDVQLWNGTQFETIVADKVVPRR